MELKKFVEDTLVQIIEGVAAAQNKCLDSGAIISPRFASSGHTVKVNDKDCSVQLVEFEAVLGEEEGTEVNGTLGVVLSKIGIGINGKKDDKNTSQTTIRFSVPIILPPIDNNERVVGQISKTALPR